MKRILRKALDLANTVIDSARTEGDSIIFEVRPYKNSQRSCPLCFKQCEAYDSLMIRRQWRTLDHASTKDPKNLTETQWAKLESIARSDAKLYKAYLLKEALRSVFSVKEPGRQLKYSMTGFHTPAVVSFLKW